MLNYKERNILLFLVAICFLLSVLLYFLPSSEHLKIVAVVLFGISLLISFLYLHLHATTPQNYLNGKLTYVERKMVELSLMELKQKHKEVCAIYGKLSEKYKANFTLRIEDLRKRIEELLTLEKKVETKLAEAQKGTFSERKRKYLEAHRLNEKLPLKEQEKYHSLLVQIRQGLEKGE